MDSSGERVIIAAGQFAPIRGSIEENIRRHQLLIAAAVSAGVDLLVFPELSLTGYEPELAEQLALSDDTLLEPLQRLADKHDMTIVVGAPLQVKDDKPAIGACIIAAQQPISFYRKMYLHPGESDYFSLGETPCLFTMGGQHIGLAICADAGQPAHAEQTVRQGAEIYVNSVLSANGYDKDAGLLANYAKLYAMPTLMANYSGPSGGWQPVGKSAVWNAKGELIAQGPVQGSALVIMALREGECSGQVICLSE